MYYVWRNVGRDLCPEIKHYTELSAEDTALHYNTKAGRPIEGAFPPTTFEVESLESLALRDSLWGGLPYLVFSPRLRAVLRHIGIANVQYFPVDIRDVHTGELCSTYHIANIIGLVPGFDWKQSVYERSPDNPARVKSISKLVLDASKVPRGLSLFRLQEMRSVILCDEAVKDALKQWAITGVRTVELEAFNSNY